MNQRKKYLFISIGLLSILIILIGLYNYNIPNILPRNFNCKNPEGFIVNHKKPFFEGNQHYVNRLNENIKNQIENLCET